jgi:hypothetical protein
MGRKGLTLRQHNHGILAYILERFDGHGIAMAFGHWHTLDCCMDS